MQTTVYFKCQIKTQKLYQIYTLSRELETCSEWLVDNRLSLHQGKTEAMLCGAKCKIKNKEGFGTKCKDTPIDVVI